MQLSLPFPNNKYIYSNSYLQPPYIMSKKSCTINLGRSSNKVGFCGQKVIDSNHINVSMNLNKT